MTPTEDTLMRAGAKLAARAQRRQEPEARRAMEGVAIILFVAVEGMYRHGRTEEAEEGSGLEACAA
jgi:hypothetical protein